MKKQPQKRGGWRGATLRLVLLLSLLPTMAGLAYLASQLLHKYPPREVGSLPVGPTRAPLARRVVMVVVDGLSIDGTRHMPRLMQLARQGAWLTAQTGPFSYSRPGYASLGTGATAELTGVTINKRSDLVPSDSIFRRARKAGLLAAIVGYAWWMELFGDDIPLASIDSAWSRNAPMLQRALATIPGPRRLPKGFVRRILHKGRYVDAGEPWRRYLRRHRITDSFGDMATKSHQGDMMRVKEALRWLRRGQAPGGWLVPEPAVSLMVVHLHGPDHAGHENGTPHSWPYQWACQLADNAIGALVGGLDLAKDTLIVTSDHGFSRAFKHAGHGGWEASASHTPLVMVGKGIKKRWLAANRDLTIHPAKRDALQLVKQIDVAPTIAVLLGLPFPVNNQGQPIWRALELPGLTVRIRRQDWYRAQIVLGQRLLGLGGWPSPPPRLRLGTPSPIRWERGRANEVSSGGEGHPQNNPTDTPSLRARWQSVQKALYKQRAAQIRWGFAARALVGLCVVGLLVWLWWFSGGGVWLRGLWWGALAWLLYEFLFIVGYIGVFGNYSLSSFRLSLMGLAAVVVWHSMVFVMVAALGWGAMRWLGVGRRWRRMTAALQGFGLCALGKAVVGSGVIGWGTYDALPHGLMYFGAAMAFFQAAAWAVGMILLGGWWPAREG